MLPSTWKHKMCTPLKKVATGVAIILVVLGVVGLLLYLFLDQPKNPIFSIESTAVKAYNLTSDNHLFCIINLGVRIHNPNHEKKHSLKYNAIGMEVRKGTRHALAGDGIWSFKQSADNDTVIAVEAVGLRKELKKKTAAELRADVSAGVGKVNVFLSGVLKKGNTKYDLAVNCKNVVVDFSKTTVKDQKVGCKLTAKSKSN